MSSYNMTLNNWLDIWVFIQLLKTKRMVYYMTTQDEVDYLAYNFRNFTKGPIWGLKFVFMIIKHLYIDSALQDEKNGVSYDFLEQSWLFDIWGREVRFLEFRKGGLISPKLFTGFLRTFKWYSTYFKVPLCKTAPFSFIFHTVCLKFMRVLKLTKSY